MLLSMCSITEYTVKIPISSDSQQDVANGFTPGNGRMHYCHFPCLITC